MSEEKRNDMLETALAWLDAEVNFMEFKIVGEEDGFSTKSIVAVGDGSIMLELAEDEISYRAELGGFIE